MGGEKALGGGEDGALAVALDASSFEYESRVVLHGGIEGSLVV